MTAIALLTVAVAGYLSLVGYLAWLTRPWRRGDPR